MDYSKIFQNPDKDLIEFLSESKFDITSLKNLAILWCNGSPEQKAKELYLNTLDSDTIVAFERNFKTNFYQLLSFSTEIPYKFANRFRDKKEKDTQPPDFIENHKDYYSDLYEEFLDEIFGYESRISQSQWENLVI